MLFRLLSGSHVENRKRFKVGDVIESSVELDKVFSNKFERVASRRILTPHSVPAKVEHEEKDEEKESSTSEVLGIESDAVVDLKPDAPVSDGGKPKEPESDAKTPGVKPVKRHRGGGRYDVINPTTGKPLNDKSLSKAEAEALTGE